MANMYLIILLLVCIALAQEDCPATTTPCFYQNVGFYQSSNSLANQHYYIGGLFGVHEKPFDAYSCSTAAIRDRGIINLEAFLWAIKNTNSLISAGGVALDSCSSSDQNIENILSFETCKVTLGETNPISPRNLLAYVGPDRSSQVPSVSSLLYEMNKTHITHAATSPKLRGGGKDEFFLRAVPTDDNDVEVMKELFEKIKVKYIIVVYQDDEYGMGMFDSFNRTMSQSDVCIVFYIKMTDSNMVEIATALQTRYMTRFVALLLTSDKTLSLMNYLRTTASQFPLGAFTFFGTSSWGRSSDISAGGGISGYTIEMSAPAFMTTENDQFYDYLKNLKPSENKHNPWYEQWWRSKVNCLTGTIVECEANPSYNLNNVRDVYTPFTIMAVRAIKKAIDTVANGACGTHVLCSGLLNQNNRGSQIRNATIQATHGTSGRRYFKDNGDLANINVNYKVYKIGQTGSYDQVR